MSDYKVQAVFDADTKEANAKVQQMSKSMQALQNGVVNGGKKMNSNLKSTRFAITNVNWVVRDSPYLFNNFSMGVMALSNNIGPMIDGFQMVIKETGSMKAGIKTLMASMVGPMGLSIAFSVIIAAIQAYSFLSARAGREAKEMGKKSRGAGEDINFLTISIDDLSTKLKDLSSDKMQGGIKAIAKGIEEVRKSEQKWANIRTLIFGSLGKMGLFSPIVESAEVKALKEKQDLLKKESQLVTKLGEIKNQIKVLEDQRNTILNNDVDATAKIRSYTDQIVALENQRKEILKSSEEIEKEREARAKKQLERAFEDAKKIKSSAQAPGAPGMLDMIPTVPQVAEKLDPVTDYFQSAWANVYGGLESMTLNFSGIVGSAFYQQAQKGQSAMRTIEKAWRNMLWNMVAQLLSKSVLFGFLNFVSGGAIGFFNNVFGGFSNLSGGGGNSSGLVANSYNGGGNLSLAKLEFLTAQLLRKDSNISFNGTLDGQTFVRNVVKPELDIIDRKAFKR